MEYECINQVPQSLLLYRSESMGLLAHRECINQVLQALHRQLEEHNKDLFVVYD